MATSLRFVEECIKSNIKKFSVFSFEPDKIPYQNCIKVKEQHLELNIRLFNKGLYSADTVVAFDSNIPGSARIVESTRGGDELETLKGARNTIKRYRPKLAV